MEYIRKIDIEIMGRSTEFSIKSYCGKVLVSNVFSKKTFHRIIHFMTLKKYSTPEPPQENFEFDLFAFDEDLMVL